MQEIYINIDDSGKISKKENVCIYGGLVFLSKDEKDKFINQYRGIIKSIKCKYCQSDNLMCNHKCPELKNSKIAPKHKRRIMNYINQYHTFACIIQNNKIYSHIMDDKSSKGRFSDYTQKRLIKQVIKDLIKEKKVDPYKETTLIINIDEQPTKTNGNYNLRDTIIEEFIFGIKNFDYSLKTQPLFFNKLTITLKYQGSSKSYSIQAADFVAGTVRHKVIESLEKNKNLFNELQFINTKIFLP